MSIFSKVAEEHLRRRAEDKAVFNKWLASIFLRDRDGESAKVRNANFLTLCLRKHTIDFRVMLLRDEVEMLKNHYTICATTLTVNKEVMVQRDWKKLLANYLRDNVDGDFDHLDTNTDHDINLNDGYISINIGTIMDYCYGYAMGWAEQDQEYEITYKVVDGKRVPGTDTVVCRPFHT